MKRYKFILKYIILFSIILIWNLIISPTDLDEIWSYGFSHNIYSSLVPYKDFNIVVTPLYPFLISLVFHLFGSNLLIFHITQALLFTMLSYFLFDLLDEKSWIVILFFFFPTPIFFPGYNLLLFFMFLLIVWLEKREANDYFIGFVLALSVLTKQSVGICFLLPNLFYLKYPKKILRRILGFSVPVLLFLLYLICTNSLYSFLDLCVFGLFDFASGNGKILNINFILLILLIVFTLFFIKRDPKNISNYYALAFYSIIIPLFDIKHFQEGFLAFLVIILLNVKRAIPINCRLLSIGVVLGEALIVWNTRDLNPVIYPNNIKAFEYRLLDNDGISLTNNVNRFLKSNNYNKFVFLDSNGYYFKIVNGYPISYLDLINVGNWGYNGSYKLLKEIKAKDDYIFLIDRDELKRGRQTDKQAIRYIMEHGKKINTIDIYDVYIIK